MGIAGGGVGGSGNGVDGNAGGIVHRDCDNSRWHVIFSCVVFKCHGKILENLYLRFTLCVKIDTHFTNAKTAWLELILPVIVSD